MGAAMRQVETLKANAERVAREKIERDERERREQVIRNAAVEGQEEKFIEKQEQMQSLVDEAMEIEPSLPEETKPEIIEYTLRFKGTKERLLRLREYMTANGITYERIV
jgi:flagellar biosynthesis/type III secretory pathway protein FliH